MKRASFQCIFVVFFATVVSGSMLAPVPQATPTTTTRPQMSIPLLPGKTIVVNSTSDSGPGSLREAIGSAIPGDSITFDSSVFPPTIPDTISLVSELPAFLDGNLVIDASNMGVVIDGSNIILSDVSGLSVVSSNNIIRGLHLMGFSKAGISVEGGVRNNTIGGDQDIGEGPLGQGNMITGNGSFGIFLYGEGTSFNTIQGNVIGTDPGGTMVCGNFSGGIFLEGASDNFISDNLIGGYKDYGIYISNLPDGHNTISGNYIGTDPSGELDLANNSANGISIHNSGYNVVGPGNVIAHNNGTGIAVKGEDSKYNHITRNSIHDNGFLGIELSNGGNKEIATPFLGSFDLQAGSSTGWTCPNCIVEVFSDSSHEGAFYEGSLLADSSGAFTFMKGAAFAGPYLTATATDPDGNTSEFSLPTKGNNQNLSLQMGNSLRMVPFQSKTSDQLVADNRLQWDINPRAGTIHNVDAEAQVVFNIGAKLVNTTFNEGEGPINWNVSETEIPVNFDRFIDKLNENGVAVNYQIHYWDKIGHAAGEELPIPRFKTDQEVQEFLDYVRLIVGHFKGRVQYYTIWDEPDACGGSVEMNVKCIEPLDYINLAKKTIPVIHEEDPQAKVVTGPVVLCFGRKHLFTLLRSDAIQLFDVISTHPFFDQAPDQDYIGYGDDGQPESFADYYYNYPTMVDSILQTASDHGFKGDYWGLGLSWSIKGVDQPIDQTEWDGHTQIQSSKYHARGVAMHLGLDAGVSSAVHTGLPASYYVVANLFTILAGAVPEDLHVEIESEAQNIVSYGFTRPNGDMVFALWTDSAAVDHYPGMPSTLTFPGMSASRLTGFDVLTGFQQELITEDENSSLVIRNLMVKDYPIILSNTSPQVSTSDRSSSNFALYQNYPNPFNRATRIKYQISKQSIVTVKVFNMLGREIASLANERQEPGSYELEFDARELPSGFYFYRLKAGGFVGTKKMMFIR